jgi:hypothetical protein
LTGPVTAVDPLRVDSRLARRRGTIWHHIDKLVARELAERLGHSDPWMSLNVYAGAIPVTEASTERSEARLASLALVSPWCLKNENAALGRIPPRC